MTTHKYSGADIARFVDLTDLSSTSTSEDIARLCAKAVKNNVAAVCVWPRFVRGAAMCLIGRDVKVATVVNFPSGDLPLHEVIGVTEQAVSLGAVEIDLVLPYKKLIAGDEFGVISMIRGVRAACPNAELKVILETSELPSLELVRKAAELSFRNGADFVKTSTGKNGTAATPEAVEILLNVAKGYGGKVKVSGGVKTEEDALSYLAMAEWVMPEGWVTPENFRFGASGLLDNLNSGTVSEGY